MGSNEPIEPTITRSLNINLDNLPPSRADHPAIWTRKETILEYDKNRQLCHLIYANERFHYWIHHFLISSVSFSDLLVENRSGQPISYCLSNHARESLRLGSFHHGNSQCLASRPNSVSIGKKPWEINPGSNKFGFSKIGCYSAANICFNKGLCMIWNKGFLSKLKSR